VRGETSALGSITMRNGDGDDVLRGREQLLENSKYCETEMGTTSCEVG
jgi:hypothetical protein